MTYPKVRQFLILIQYLKHFDKTTLVCRGIIKLEEKILVSDKTKKLIIAILSALYAAYIQLAPTLGLPSDISSITTVISVILFAVFGIKWNAARKK